jgi:hypothetical protein
VRLLELEDKARQNPLLKSAARTIVEFLKYVDRGYQKGWADEDGRVVVHYPHVAKELAITRTR